MNIAVVGAGPVGLYAASLLRHLYPDGHVHMFEKRSKDQLSGFGYTIHGESLGLLGILHPDVVASIELRGTKPFTKRTITFRDKHVELDPEVSRKMPIIGIEYDSLIKILKTQADITGVELHYESAVTDLDGLAQDNDLVIVANGANSSFLERFDPMRVETGLSYAWGKKEEISDEMAMTIDTFDDIPFICHKYPISKTTTVLIIEVREENEAHAAQKLALDPRTMQFCPEGVIFKKIPLCLCRKRVHHNIVCIGDTALAQYFAAGAGLYFGLMQTGILFHNLEKTPGSVDQKLRAYDAQARDYLRFQWKPNQTLIKNKQGLLAEYALMTDDAVAHAMVAVE